MYAAEAESRPDQKRPWKKTRATSSRQLEVKA